MRHGKGAVTLDRKYKGWRVTHVHIKTTGAFAFIRQDRGNVIATRRVKLNKDWVLTDY